MSERIYCYGCLKDRYSYTFSPEEANAEKPLCKQCKKGHVKESNPDKVFGVRVKSKIRKCLKCDKEFHSFNENRICTPCKSVNKYGVGNRYAVKDSKTKHGKA